MKSGINSHSFDTNSHLPHRQANWPDCIVPRLAYYFSIWIGYVAQFLKRRFIYALDFWAGLAANLTLHGVNLLFIQVIFSRVSSLKGWNFHELLFIYGMFLMSFGIYHALFSGVYWIGGKFVIEGQLDRVLLRPLDPLFQIISERVQVEDIGEFFVGVGITLYAGLKLGLTFTWLHWLALPVWVLSGVAIYVGVYTSLASASFWIMDRIGLIPPVYNMMDFSRYPVTIYNRWLRAILCWIIPFSFVGFFPSTWFLGREEYLGYFLLTPLIGLVAVVIGFTLFHLGLRRYESAGT
jgi:ABC-2 type transport system permease protein